MAVRTDEFTLGHLSLDPGPRTAVRDHDRDGADLDATYVIPVEAAGPLRPTAVVAATFELDASFRSCISKRRCQESGKRFAARATDGRRSCVTRR